MVKVGEEGRSVGEPCLDPYCSNPDCVWLLSQGPCSPGQQCNRSERWVLLNAQEHSALLSAVNILQYTLLLGNPSAYARM